MHPAIRYLNLLTPLAGLGRHVRALPLLVGVGVGVALGVPLGSTLNLASSNAVALQRPAAGSNAAQSFNADASMLETLRTRASSGDTLPNLELIDVLLDQFDATGDTGPLYEAMIWVDRRWLMSGEAEAAPRVQARYCGHPVVRWHTLCQLGE